MVILRHRKVFILYDDFMIIYDVLAEVAKYWSSKGHEALEIKGVIYEKEKKERKGKEKHLTNTSTTTHDCQIA